MLGSDARVIEPRGDRVRRMDLPGRILQQVAACAVQHTWPSPRQRCGMAIGIEPLPRSLDPDQLDVCIIYEWMKNPHRVRSSTHTRHHGRRKAADLREHLRPCLASDHSLELTYHPWIGCGSNH